MGTRPLREREPAASLEGNVEPGGASASPHGGRSGMNTDHLVPATGRKRWLGRRRYVLALGLLTIALSAGVAAATPPSNISSEIFARGTSADRISVIESRISLGRISIGEPAVSCGPVRNCDVVVQTLTFHPGGSSGWHSHPGLVSVVVRSGALTRYEVGHFGIGCSSRTYSAGQAFFEVGSDHVALVRNETGQAAEVVATYIIPAGDPLRLDRPAPAGCLAQG